MGITCQLNISHNSEVGLIIVYQYCFGPEKSVEDFFRVKKRYMYQKIKEEENRKDRKNVPVQFPDHPSLHLFFHPASVRNVYCG